MDYLEAVFLGILQGVTEFLPVSSSGHLLLLEKWGVGEPSVAVNLFLHIGTLLSVLTVYRKKILSILTNPFCKENGFYILACIPTGLIALIFVRYFKGALNGSFLPLNFMITAVLLTIADFKKSAKTNSLNIKNVLLTGVFQGIAVLPGVSRSGATISALTLSGVEKERAAEFSFLLSVPVIIVGALAALTDEAAVANIKIAPLLAGMCAAFLSGVFAIGLTVRAVKRKRFLPFSIYLTILSIVSSITLCLI